jgi:hypothetical protein
LGPFPGVMMLNIMVKMEESKPKINCFDMHVNVPFLSNRMDPFDEAWVKGRGWAFLETLRLERTVFDLASYLWLHDLFDSLQKME